MTITPLDVVILAIAFTAGTAGAWWSLHHDLNSLTRYKLWRLRDQIVDAMLIQESIPDKRAFVVLVDEIESAIQHIADYNLLFLACVRASISDEFVSQFQSERRAEESRLTPAERTELGKWRRRYITSLTGHIFTGSVLGWFAMFFFGAFFLAVGFLKMMKRPLVYAKGEVISSVSNETDRLTMTLRRDERGSLSACV